MSIKLSHRLNTIASLIGPQPAQIWDCCCDHGLLGAELLNHGHQVHFVDVVPEIMQALEGKLQRFFPHVNGQAPNWFVHCADVARLPLIQHPTQLPIVVIIAGIGGELMCELLQALQPIIHQRHTPLSLILCPVNHAYLVRQQVRSMPLLVTDELLVEENRRFYEIMQLNTHHGKPITATGDSIWQAQPANTSDTTTVTTSTAKRYQQKLLDHYQRRLIGAEKTADQNAIKHLNKVIAAYQGLNLSR
ncbi:tRNA (adenine(22)-N(1))-methyltransferase TrmK [Shewanella sp. Scap07]|uniref:tRNA (adenine(22)-N(1))-methyltransferase n=1 Tax=Shewanella sp. Scap07 TaxID=2589987 RepID=UPI0015BB81BF|nr:tRNA (adenine(22)-N(1))-methyltransferase TrmK [Shewanella sp. Scap07]